MRKRDKSPIAKPPSGLVLSTTCFLLAYVVAKKILPSIGGVAIHYFAWMVLIVAR
ncbi:Na(+)Citrate OH(-) antiporter [Klebsiella pneumoniae]|uniref:Na(+)Citrate OH(-) antiporter n=1 Tax=Klebsiella pneumoniae TaxID=573 RepID=A0A377TPS9_KLEPN|nr:Na(+)Citrate OH(-) antiporter [Klebsiella pneumoniae]